MFDLLSTDLEVSTWVHVWKTSNNVEAWILFVKLSRPGLSFPTNNPIWHAAHFKLELKTSKKCEKRFIMSNCICCLRWTNYTLVSHQLATTILHLPLEGEWPPVRMKEACRGVFQKRHFLSFEQRRLPTAMHKWVSLMKKHAMLFELENSRSARMSCWASAHHLWADNLDRKNSIEVHSLRESGTRSKVPKNPLFNRTDQKVGNLSTRVQRFVWLRDSFSALPGTGYPNTRLVSQVHIWKERFSSSGLLFLSATGTPNHRTPDLNKL